MNSFGAYRDPRILPRHPHGCQPDRPDPNATTAALERRHPELVNIMVERSARYGDGRDANVYAWESHIWADAGLDDSPLLSRRRLRTSPRVCGRDTRRASGHTFRGCLKSAC